MHATSYNYRRGASAFACLIMALSGVNASAAAPKEADAFTVFDSYVKISGKSAAVTGNSAAYARRFQLPENGSYGIEALHLNKELNKTIVMVTHDPAAAERAKIVRHLDKGAFK